MSRRPLKRARRAREPGGIVLLFTGAWSKLRKMFYGLKHRLRLFGLRHRGVDRPRRWVGQALDDDERLGHCLGCGDSRGLDAPVCLRGLLSTETVGAFRRTMTPCAGASTSPAVPSAGGSPRCFRLRWHRSFSCSGGSGGWTGGTGPRPGSMPVTWCRRRPHPRSGRRPRQALCKVLMEDLRDRWSP